VPRRKEEEEGRWRRRGTLRAHGKSKYCELNGKKHSLNLICFQFLWESHFGLSVLIPSIHLIMSCHNTVVQCWCLNPPQGPQFLCAKYTAMEWRTV
jgi:hypothetical protein